MTENENMTTLEEFMELVTKIQKLQVLNYDLPSGSKELPAAIGKVKGAIDFLKGIYDRESKLQIQEPDSDSDSDSSIHSPYVPRELTERDRILLSIRQQMSDEEDRNGYRTWGIPDDNHTQNTSEVDDAYQAEQFRRYDELMAKKETDTKTL